MSSPVNNRTFSRRALVLSAAAGAVTVTLSVPRLEIDDLSV